MKFLFSAILLISLSVLSWGQTQTYTVQTPQMLIGGNYNNGSGDTGMVIVKAAALPKYTARDTVRNANSGTDSAHAKIFGAANSLTFEDHVTLDSGGTNCDSVAVRFWGTATQGNGQGSPKLLQTNFLTATNGTEQVFTYLPNNGIGNPYTNYWTTIDVMDAVNTCRVSWQGWLLFR